MPYASHITIFCSWKTLFLAVVSLLKQELEDCRVSQQIAAGDYVRASLASVLSVIGSFHNFMQRPVGAHVCVKH